METVHRAYAYDEDPVALFKYCINFEMSPQTREELLRELSSQFLGDDSKHLPELYLSKSECGMLAAMGHTIGSHSHRHRPTIIAEPRGLRHRPSGKRSLHPRGHRPAAHLDQLSKWRSGR